MDVFTLLIIYMLFTFVLFKHNLLANMQFRLYVISYKKNVIKVNIT